LAFGVKDCGAFVERVAFYVLLSTVLFGIFGVVSLFNASSSWDALNGAALK
jgi:hypothetical protein